MSANVVYADNAATSALDREAFEVMKEYLLDYYGNASQPYSFSKKSRKALEQARNIIADCINAEPEEIIFTSGGSESNNCVIKSCSPATVIYTSEIEHHSILNAIESMSRKGNIVKYLPVDQHGIIDISKVDWNINNPKLVSLMLANNEIGTIQPIKDFSQIVHQHGGIIHTDAVQAIGHIPVDVKKLDVDYLSSSAHKFNGPKGIGFLYKKKNVQLTPLIDGGKQEFNLRAGTENIASIMGMAIALKNNCQQLANNMQYVTHLENLLIEKLNETSINYIRNGYSNHIPGNISLSFKNDNGERLLHRLDLMNVYISTGSACDSQQNQVSHVIKAIKVPDIYKMGTVRISLCKHNTEEEVIYIVNCLKKILK